MRALALTVSLVLASWVGRRPGLVMAQASAAAQAPRAAPPAVTAFVDVAVVPMDREQVLAHQTVLVRGDRITALGPVAQVAVPAGAVRIDGRGQYLIPGLADMHAHVHAHMVPPGAALGQLTPAEVAQAQALLLLWLANGVTTVRVVGYAPPEVLALRAQAARGALLSPRLYVAAGPLRAGDGRAAARAVEAAQRAGYDMLALYAEEGPGFESAVAAARRVGLPLVGYPLGAANYTAANIQRAIQAGYRSIEHLAELHVPGDGPLPARAAELPAVAAALQHAGVWVTPTLTRFTASGSRAWEGQLLFWANREMYGSTGINMMDPRFTWPELRYINDSTFKPLPSSSGFRTIPLLFSRYERYLLRDEVYDQTVQTLQKAGVGLLLGTDAGTGLLRTDATDRRVAPMAGFAVHRELQALVTAGLTPYEALLTGTRNAAAYLGTLDSVGTVAVGKRADLVLLAGNPLDDIRHTAQPAGVMTSGRWLARADLAPMLARLEGTITIR